MSNFTSNALSAAAAASARRAEEAANAAKNASEERLEGTQHNPFIAFETLELETVAQEVAQDAGFFKRLFGVSKSRLEANGRTWSVKKSDIGYLSQDKDDYGNVFTIVNLEERCDLLEYEDIQYFRVRGTIEEVQNYINSK